MSEFGTTTRVRSVVTLANGEVYPGYIHLVDWAHHRAGPETPVEMLNRQQGFFPLTQDDGAAIFIPKPQVAMVTCEWPPEGWPPEGVELLPEAGRRLAIEVRLANGEEFRGQVSVSLPPDRARALDYLNASEHFFQLVTEGAPRIFNRAHVTVVRPLD
ncbi:MAG TPA: hypothetical protein VGA78_16575 [Gemmatimonadales bacterium]|jgi:hypothetical protein